MLPLKDDIPSRRFPVVTLALIAANIFVFLVELTLGPRLQSAVLMFGIVPVRYTVPEFHHLFNPVEQAIPFLSSMFLHGGWTHLLGNMWTLWIFGDNVEDRLGRARYVGSYIVGGLVAAVLHIMTNLHSGVPTIGASGAVAAVMGAYFRLYPHARILTVIPPFFFGPTFVLPAVLFLGWWFLLQFFSGSLSLMASHDQAGGIAWWAHVGGFIFGALIGGRFRNRRIVYDDDEEELSRW